MLQYDVHKNTYRTDRLFREGLFHLQPMEFLPSFLLGHRTNRTFENDYFPNLITRVSHFLPSNYSPRENNWIATVKRYADLSPLSLSDFLFEIQEGCKDSICKNSKEMDGYSSIGLLLFFALLVFQAQTSSALKCHVCNSLYNESCAVVEDSRYVVDCGRVNEDPDRNHTICRKEVFSVTSPAFDMASSRTVRTCGYEKHPKFNCFYNSNHDLKETICECVEDACNGSSSLRFALQVLAAAVLTTYFVSFAS